MLELHPSTSHQSVVLIFRRGCEGGADDPAVVLTEPSPHNISQQDSDKIYDPSRTSIVWTLSWSRSQLLDPDLLSVENLTQDLQTSRSVKMTQQGVRRGTIASPPLALTVGLENGPCLKRTRRTDENLHRTFTAATQVNG